MLTLSPEPRDSRRSDFAALGVQFGTLGLSRIKGVFYAEGELYRRIADIGPDIIHSQGFRADVLSAKLKIKIPKICTVRNFPQHDYAMTYGFISKIMLPIHKRAMRRIDTCIGVSEAVSENLKNTFGIVNSIFIRNGVTLKFFILLIAK